MTTKHDRYQRLGNRDEKCYVLISKYRLHLSLAAKSPIEQNQDNLPFGLEMNGHNSWQLALPFTKQLIAGNFKMFRMDLTYVMTTVEYLD